MSAQTNDNETFIFFRRAKVKALTGLSASTIWRLEQKKDFPARYQISKNIVAYKSNEVMAWLNTRFLATNNSEVKA